MLFFANPKAIYLRARWSPFTVVDTVIQPNKLIDFKEQDRACIVNLPGAKFGARYDEGCRQ